MPSQLFTVHQECERCGCVYLPFDTESTRHLDYSAICESCRENADARAYAPSELAPYVDGDVP